MNPSTNQIELPTIPIRVDVNIEPHQSAMLAFSLFIAMVLALLIFGFVFKN